MKTKNEIQIRFSKWCENEKQNSYPFFKVIRKRKTKNEVQMRFSTLGENEKQIAKFKSVFNVMRKRKTKNGSGIWIPFSHAIEKRLALRYTHWQCLCKILGRQIKSIMVCYGISGVVNCLRSLPAFVGCFLELTDLYWVLRATNVFFKVSRHFYDESEFIVASLSPLRGQSFLSWNSTSKTRWLLRKLRPPKTKT